VGIDDDKMNLTVAVLKGSSQQEPEMRRIPNEDQALRRWVRKLVREAEGGEIRMCYEAGPNGFALMRRLEAMGGPVVVEVMAPSLTPRRPGQRVKTDPIDASKLAHLYRSGELRAIAIPDESSEAAHDLVRIYHRVGEEATRKRHHILKFLTRRGRIYREGCHWTGKHRAWLKKQEFEFWTDKTGFEELLSGLRELEDRRTRLERDLERLAQEDVRAMEIGDLQHRALPPSEGSDELLRHDAHPLPERGERIAWSHYESRQSLCPLGFGTGGQALSPSSSGRGELEASTKGPAGLGDRDRRPSSSPIAQTVLVAADARTAALESDDGYRA
jgi:hypothetical protein